MELLLTGGSGLLGRELIRALVCQKDITLKALLHKTPFEESRVSTVEGDLMNPQSLEVATRGVNTVIHLAALTHTTREKDYFKINLDGTKNLVEACLKNQVRRFIYISSLAAHPHGGSYSVSKLHTEDYLKEQKISWVIVRPSEIYGPSSTDAINKIIQWIKRFPAVPVIGNGTYKLAPVFVDDIIEALIRIIMDPSIKKITFILAGPETISYRDLIDRLSRYFHVRPVKLYLPIFLAKGVASILIWLNMKILVQDQIPRLLCPKDADITLSRKYLNFRPRTLEEGLDWYGKRN